MIYPTNWGAAIRKKGQWLLGKSLTKRCAILLYSLAEFFLMTLVLGKDR